MAITSAKVTRTDPRQEAFSMAMQALKDLQTANQARQAIAVERDRITESRRQFNGARSMELFLEGMKGTAGGLKGFMESPQGLTAFNNILGTFMDTPSATQIGEAIRTGAMSPDALLEWSAAKQLLSPDRPNYDTETKKLNDDLATMASDALAQQQEMMKLAQGGGDQTSEVFRQAGVMPPAASASGIPGQEVLPSASPGAAPDVPQAGGTPDPAGDLADGVDVVIPPVGSPPPTSAEPSRSAPEGSRSTIGPADTPEGDTGTSAIERAQSLGVFPKTSKDRFGLDKVDPSAFEYVPIEPIRQQVPAMAAVAEEVAGAHASNEGDKGVVAAFIGNLPMVQFLDLDLTPEAMKEGPTFKRANRMQQSAMERRQEENREGAARLAEIREAMSGEREVTRQMQQRAGSAFQGRRVMPNGLVEPVDWQNVLQNVESLPPRVREYVFGASQERGVELQQSGTTRRVQMQLDNAFRQFAVSQGLARDQYSFNRALEMLKLKIARDVAELADTQDPLLEDQLKMGLGALERLLDTPDMWTSMFKDGPDKGRAMMNFDIAMGYLESHGATGLPSAAQYTAWNEDLRTQFRGLFGGVLRRLFGVTRSDPFSAPTGTDPEDIGAGRTTEGLGFRGQRALQEGVGQANPLNVPNPSPVNPITGPSLGGPLSPGAAALADEFGLR